MRRIIKKNKYCLAGKYGLRWQLRGGKGFADRSRRPQYRRGALTCGLSSHWSAGLSITSYFFQAEDGLRDYKGTGVQTCALPIYDVFGDGKMAVRGGMGLFSERLRQNNFNFGAGAQWPNLISGSVYNGNVKSINTDRKS